MRFRWLLMLGLGVADPVAGLQQPLSMVAEAAREALQRGDVDALLLVPGGRDVRAPTGARIQLQLPNAEPSMAVGPEQAGASLRGLLRRGEAHQVRVQGFREVGGGRGYVELVREYRVPGSGERREQRILLGYRRMGGAWNLAEVRVN